MQGKLTLSNLIIISLILLIISGAGFWIISAPRQHEAAADAEPAPAFMIPGQLLEVPAAIWSSYRSLAGSAPEPAADFGKQVTILLLGLDTRGLSDAIMIVSYNDETFESSIIALKRDTYVSFQDWSEKGRGHSALGWANFVGMGYGEGEYIDGAGYAAHTVSRLLGIEIDYYASITFDGFIELIDLIGGVTVDVPSGFAERSGPKLTPGRQHLSGEEALIFARHRMKPRIPEPNSISEDGDRVRRNQRLLQAVLQQCKTLSTDELLEIYNQLGDNLHSNLDDWELLTMANLFFNKDPREMNLIVLPGEIRTVHEDIIEEDVEYFFLDEAESAKILSDLGLK